MPSFNCPPLAAVASSLAGWDGSSQGQMGDMDSVTPKPVFHHESDFVSNPFAPFADGSMGYANIPFGLDPLSLQSDMDAYRMGLKEYGIMPANNL